MMDFKRMGGQMRYVTADNRDFLLTLLFFFSPYSRYHITIDRLTDCRI
jgi:hypothetical protein